jgi:hypothetical protein
MILTSSRVSVAKVDLSKFDEKLLRKQRKKLTKEEIKGRKINLKIKRNQKNKAGKNIRSSKRLKRLQYAKKKVVPRSKELLELQKSVDKEVLISIKKIPRMANYLRSHFTLSDTQRPHLMRF